jgi:hypothetical protein
MKHLVIASVLRNNGNLLDENYGRPIMFISAVGLGTPPSTFEVK